MTQDELTEALVDVLANHLTIDIEQSDWESLVHVNVRFKGHLIAWDSLRVDNNQNQ